MPVIKATNKAKRKRMLIRAASPDHLIILITAVYAISRQGKIMPSHCITPVSVSTKASNTDFQQQN